MRHRGTRLFTRPVAACTLVLSAVALLMTTSDVGAQVSFPSGQNIAPVYEGWEQNPDGTFNLVFGYFNRNFEEEIDLPIGPDNSLEPGGPDRGQPTHFYPRRNRFLFRIQVAKDFGTKELVWTLTSHGKTERAYATLKPDYFMNDIVVMNNNGAGGSGGGGNNINTNKPPKLELDGQKRRTAKVGELIAMTANASDDGIPRRRVIRASGGPRPPAAGAAGAPASTTAPAGASTNIPSRIGTRCCPDSASGLRVAWFVYRGAASKVTFDPPQIEVWEDYRDGRNSPYSEGWEPPEVPADGKWNVRVSFSEPGTYVLRCQAHDGGLSVTEDVTFVVTR